MWELGLMAVRSTRALSLHAATQKRPQIQSKRTDPVVILNDRNRLVPALSVSATLTR
jgi:hypothetical protein